MRPLEAQGSSVRIACKQPPACTRGRLARSNVGGGPGRRTAQPTAATPRRFSCRSTCGHGHVEDPSAIRASSAISQRMPAS